MLLSRGRAAARKLSGGATGRRFGVADPLSARTISSRSKILKTTREPLQQPPPAAKKGFTTGWRHAIALVATATTAAGFAAGVTYSTKGKGVSASAMQEHPEVESNPTSASDLSEVLPLLRQAVGDDNVTMDDAERESHGKPHFSYHEIARNPDVIVTPASTDEVVAVVKACAKHNIPMIPYGGATSLEGHILAPMGGCSIDFSRMDRVLRLSRADHDVTIQPGLGYVDLNEMLKPHGLWFPLDPGPGASLGGMCACSCSGSTAVRYGTMKDNVVCLTAVLANGEVVKTSSRAKKSSAGYDLTRLFVGSEGTLGIITELTVKVHKIPTHSNAVRVAFKSIDDAAKAVQDVLAAGIQVGRAEMLDDTMMAVLNKVNKTKHEEATTLLFEVAGESADSVKHAQAAVLRLAKIRGGGPPHLATEPAECKELWQERKEALWSLMGLYPDLECMITDVCVPVSRLAELIGSCKKELDASPLPAPIVAHAGDGNFHALIMFDKRNPEHVREANRLSSVMVDKGDGNFHAFIMFDKHDPSATAEANRLSSLMVHKALEMEGTCTGEHGVGVGKIKYLPHEHGPGAMHAMRVIKRGLDPKGLMNPGKILEHRRDPATGRLVLCS